MTKSLNTLTSQKKEGRRLLVTNKKGKSYVGNGGVRFSSIYRTLSILFRGWFFSNDEIQNTGRVRKTYSKGHAIRRASIRQSRKSVSPLCSKTRLKRGLVIAPLLALTPISLANNEETVTITKSVAIAQMKILEDYQEDIKDRDEIIKQLIKKIGKLQSSSNCS